MFEIGETFWFQLKSDKRDVVNIKGKVMEENEYMVKIKRDDGKIEIIPFNRIMNVNRAREEGN